MQYPIFGGFVRINKAAGSCCVIANRIVITEIKNGGIFS